MSLRATGVVGAASRAALTATAATRVTSSTPPVLAVATSIGRAATYSAPVAAGTSSAGALLHRSPAQAGLATPATSPRGIAGVGMGSRPLRTIPTTPGGFAASINACRAPAFTSAAAAAAADAAAGAPGACTVPFLDSFLAASVRFCAGAPEDRLFNSASAKQGTGFQHVDVFELPKDATLPFLGNPPLEGGLVLPSWTSQMLQRSVADRWDSCTKRAYDMCGGSGIGKTVLLNVLVAKAFATLPGRDIICHDEDTKTFYAILRSKEALERAGVAPGQTHVVQELNLRGVSSRAEQERVVCRAFPTFGSRASIYLYNPAATAADGSSEPFFSHGITIAAGSLNALSLDFKRRARGVIVPDAAAEVFVEQAAVVLADAGRDFNLKLLALLYCMWGPSLRAALAPQASTPNVLRPLAEPAGASALTAARTPEPTLTNRLVGSNATLLCDTLRTTVFHGVEDDGSLFVRLYGSVTTVVAAAAGEWAESKTPGVGAGEITKATAKTLADEVAPKPDTVKTRIAALLDLWGHALDDGVNCGYFASTLWSQRLPKVTPPAFLTQVPAWVDPATGKRKA